MIYLDTAATTNITQPVLDAMMPYLTYNFGNPSSQHMLGRGAKTAVERAREQVADAINAQPEQIFFTSGASESNNWISANTNVFVCSKFEHPSVYMNPNRVKMLDTPIDFDCVLRFKNVGVMLSHIMVNNETGTIYPIKDLTNTSHVGGIKIHTDATQAFGHTKVDVVDLGVDYLSMSAHKFHGPKGVGILYIKEPNGINSLIYGGKQEKSFRAGTENVAGIVGTGIAAELYKYNPNIGNDVKAYKETLANQLSKEFNVIINNTENSIPNILSVSFKSVDAETLVLQLSSAEIFVSSGAACSSGVSNTIKSLNLPAGYENGTIRFSFDQFNDYDEIPTVIKTLKNFVR